MTIAWDDSYKMLRRDLGKNKVSVNIISDDTARNLTSFF